MVENSLGLGAADFIALGLAAALVAGAFVWQPFVQRRFAALAIRTRTCMFVLAALPIALRLLLLPNHPIPTPEIYDEFSHLLVADTFLHFRLANPPHALPQFFETFFVLQRPTYSSIYPPGQGLMLAFGRAVSGQAWTGVLLAVAALCSLSYWMLRAWTTPRWALVGGLLAVIEFGPLNTWMNSYWGGALPAAAGCVVFGALPRLKESWRRRDAILLGLGLGICAMTRPFESILLALSIMLFFVPPSRRRSEIPKLAHALPYFLLAISPFLLLVLAQNKQVTGAWLTLPEQLSQYQYGVPTTLTIQKPAVPHHPLTPQQELDYRAQALTHGSDTDTVPRFLARLEYRIRYYRFFFLSPLYLTLVAFLFTVRRPRIPWVIGTLTIFALGTNLFPYLLPHYLAAVTCLFLFVSVAGLQRLSEFAAGRQAAIIILVLCGAHFAFWYSLHLLEAAHLSSEALQYETWDAINQAGPQRRVAIARRLAVYPGKQLVFVRYWPHHRYQDEWVWNAADIDGSRIVMARDLGATENEKLRGYFRDRTVWLLEPDASPPKLTPYAQAASSHTETTPPSAPFIDVK